MSRFIRRSKGLGLSLLATLLLGVATLVIPGTVGVAQSIPVEATTLERLAPQLQVGDVVFIRIPYLLTRKIAEAEEIWTNHVGVVIDTSGPEPTIAESRIPLSGASTLSQFVARSENGRVAVRRLPRPLSTEEAEKLAIAAQERFGRLYDLGFNLHSSREFCSKYVREVMLQATGEPIGEVETFATLLARHPRADQSFWKWWYFGAIPWQRQTVTPGSQLTSPRLSTLFDGRVVTKPEHSGNNRGA
ncbi:YiiX/YebB-like N1pC/P60 family cysteine hydrolase [Uliginosibacterium gangwonense]|uniref:YiiX/YebB-like N1pC/P60 family cysteine hydrolase n=1 Tax=Uliginosibacterium gangwonense TaxID=392736 RepID=UPI000375034E|nr:YiiX/YebB-like N1pC/P60 family cysteine hydrolase [Uliginosibacterium gangwonense]